MKAYHILGGRPIKAFARVWFDNGVASGRTLFVAATVLPNETSGRDFGYELIGENGYVISLDPHDFREPHHPEYEIRRPGGCEVCSMIYTRFTPTTSKADVTRLSETNFSCLTRWFVPCRTRRDIMPAAWVQERADDPSRSSLY